MSSSCCRVALAAQLSLQVQGSGIACRCSQPGAKGTPINPVKSPCVTLKRQSSSKQTETDGEIGKNKKYQAPMNLQERLKCLKESLTSASARAQDSLHNSREAFLGTMHALHISSGDKETKSKLRDEGEDGHSDKTYKVCNNSTTSDPNQNSTVRSDHESEDVYDDVGLEKKSSTRRDVSPEVKESKAQYTQPEFWINIPSFQDRINRMTVPFRRTTPQSSTTESATENSQEDVQQEDGVVHLEPRDKVCHSQQRDEMTRDADALKPESYNVTAEVKSDQLTDHEPVGSSDHRKNPPLKISSPSITIPSIKFSNSFPDVIKSIPGLVSSEDSRGKPSEDGGDKSMQASKKSDFDFDASPILEMNVAMLEPKETQGERKVLAARETEAEAQMRKERTIEPEEVAAKKATRKPMKPVISKACIDDRTRNLAIGIRCATSNSSRLLKLEKLAPHLMRYPESREVAVKEKLIPSLLKIQNVWDKALMEQVNEVLALLGYVPPVKGRGIRILSVDGGGTRGVIAIEALREIERRTNKPIRELFDYMIGVSSGAVLCFLLAFDGTTLDECEELYRELSQDVFKRNTFLGTSKLFLNHAFYDTEGWIKILRTHSLGDIPMMSTARDATCPKVAAVAAMMNVGCIKDFLFRNYNLPSGVQSHYRGSCKYELWQAARASSAAPGYFEEFKLDDHVFQDGGVLTNNPSALAIHECRLLWPDTPIQCVVSMGCGRYDPSDENTEPEYSSLKKKLTNIMMSATDTESVHTVLQDLLPSGAYFRFNPSITEDFFLDENRTEKILQMQLEARDYLELNELKMEQVSGVISREKTRSQRLMDWVRLQREMRR